MVVMNTKLLVAFVALLLVLPGIAAAVEQCAPYGADYILTDITPVLSQEPDSSDPSQMVNVLHIYVTGTPDLQRAVAVNSYDVAKGTTTEEAEIGAARNDPQRPAVSTCFVSGVTEKIRAYHSDGGPSASVICKNGQDGLILNNLVRGEASPDNPLEIERYEATCVIDSDAYRGICKNLVIQYVPSDPTSKIKGSTYQGTPVQVCGDLKSANAFDQLRGVFRDLFKDVNQVACIASVLLFGFLLASMYLSGKSPMSLLDITTPRMPSPKGFAAGGQSVVGFGYTELKATTAASNLKSRAALAGLSAVVMKGLSAGQKAQINKSVGGIAGSSAKRAIAVAGTPATSTPAELNSKEAYRGLATFAVKYGYEGGKIPTNLAKMIGSYSKEEMAQAGKILAYAEARATTGLERQAIGHIRQLFAGTKMEATLAQVTAGQSTMAQFTSRIAATPFAGYRSIRPLVAGGIHDSAYRGARVGWGFVKSVAGEVTRAGLAVASGFKTDQAMANLSARAKKGDTFAAAVHKIASATSNDMMPIGAVDKMKDRAAQMYKDLHKEAYNDLIRSMLVKLYDKHGVNFKMTKEQLLAFAYKDVDVLKAAGWHGQTALLDKQILKVLSDHSLSPTQKVDAIRRLCETNGVHVHASVVQEQSFLDTLGRGDKGEDHVRLVKLYRHLLDHHEANAATGASTDGHKYAIAKDHLSSEEQWQVMNLRRMIYDAEGGHLSKDAGLQHVLMGTYLHMTNSLVGLDPTKNAQGLKQLKAMFHDGEFEAIGKRNMMYLKELLTAEGAAWLTKFGGSANNLEDVAKLFTTKEKIKGERGFSEQAGANRVFGLEAQGVIGAKGQGKFGGADFNETGPIAGAFKIDMKRNWNLTYNEGASFETVQWYYNRLYRGQREYHDLDVERVVNAKFGVKSSQQIGAGKEVEYQREYRRELVSKAIGTEMNNYFNMFGQNTYTDARNTFHMYVKAMGGILARGFEDTDKSKAAHKDDIRFIEDMNPLNKSDMERFAKMLKDNEKQFSAWMDKPVSYRDISHSERPWIMLYEGSLVPYVKGMPLSPNDRPLGGRVAIQNGTRWEAFDPHAVKMDFERFNLHSLGAQYRQLMSDPNYAHWEPLIKEAKTSLMKQGIEGERIFNALLTHCAKTTGNYLDPMQYGTARIVPKRQVAPGTPTFVNFFTDDVVNTEPFRRVRNAFLGVGDSISRMSLVTSGDVLRASYEINVISEIYRQASWNLVMQIYNTNWDKEFAHLSPEMKKKNKEALYAFADSYGPYLDVWQRAIDRAPNRFDTSTGIHGKYGGVFQFGLAHTFDVRQNVKNYYSKSEYVSFMAQGGFLMIGAQQLSKPFVNTFRSIQQSMSGETSRWDYQARDVFHTYDPTLPRWKSVFASMSFLQTIGKLQDNYFQNPEVVRHLTGPVMGAGMKVTRHEMMHILKGTESHARTGDANPGMAHLDLRHTLKLAGTMGSYATSTSRFGNFGAFFAEDPYISRQAYQNEVRRNVSAEALAIRREEELVTNRDNPHKNWTPLGFIWGFPVAPNYSLRELVGKAFIANRTGQGVDVTAGAVKAAKSVGEGVKSMVKRELTNTCRHCGHGGAVGSGRCSSCGHVRQFEGSNTLQFKRKPRGGAGGYGDEQAAA